MAMSNSSSHASKEKCKKTKYKMVGIVKGENKNAFVSFVSSLMKTKRDARRVVHGIKVGMALVLVSLVYLLNPLFKQVGQNAMWAIMTVVVVFEFYAGSFVF